MFLHGPVHAASDLKVVTHQNLSVAGVIESGFVRGEERWGAVESTGRSVPVNYNAVTQSLAVSAPGRDKVYFLAPGKCSSGFWVSSFFPI